ncbi:hypothetical protein E2C01_092173 [Portunus trituberculatus]|uniref:Uncharacterized protein n=1 Tax=Portunus trituberculatus TaxID=210409 RepID=A0A5B7JR18_PORTR|nr:hypothetical protein [Portunus trituberculatus]
MRRHQGIVAWREIDELSDAAAEVMRELREPGDGRSSCWWEAAAAVVKEKRMVLLERGRYQRGEEGARGDGRVSQGSGGWQRVEEATRVSY